MNHQRLLLGIILFLLLISLMLYYSLEHNNYDPDQRYILENFEAFNGTNVIIGGVVRTVDRTNNTIQIELSHPPNHLILLSTIENISTTHPGDIVEVYGTLTSRNHIEAEKLLITERWKDDLVYLRSLPAVPFALFLFFRTYRFNTDTRRFERRRPHG